MSRYIEIGRTCACANLRMASRIITNVYDRFLQPSGLKVTQLAMLMAIKILAPVTITHLADKILMDRTTCTRNLKALQVSGFIRIEPAKDRRMKIIVLTDSGSDRIKKAIPLWEDAQNFIYCKAGEEKVTGILEDLHGMITAIRKV